MYKGIQNADKGERDVERSIHEQGRRYSHEKPSNLVWFAPSGVGTNCPKEIVGSEAGSDEIEAIANALSKQGSYLRFSNLRWHFSGGPAEG